MTHTRYLIIGIAMLAAAGLALALAPRGKIADHGPKVDLETMIPKQFGEWNMDKTIVPLQVSPEAALVISTLYSQTLARTYINAKGYRIMLSIAYGSNQTDHMQVHRPDVCYPAQGFAIQSKHNEKLVTQLGDIPVRRMFAIQGSRYEPITYWLTVGDSAVEQNFQKKLVEMRYGLTGQIPDGLLFRVSSIDPSEQAGYDHQDKFVRDLLQAVTPAARIRLSGIGTSRQFLPGT